MGRKNKNKTAETTKVEEVGYWPAEQRKACTEADIKAASDKRRRERKKQHIRIHADRIENLDDTAERIKKEGEEAKETGYKSICRMYYRESRWNWLRKIVNSMTSWAYPYGKNCCPLVYKNRLELKRNFVKNKVVTRCATMFLGKNKGKKNGLIMQPVPVEYLNRMPVEHVEKKTFGWIRRWPYYMDLNSYSAVELMRCAGVNPLANKEVRLRLVEIKGKDGAAMTYYYKMQPIGSYVPMELDNAE